MTTNLTTEQIDKVGNAVIYLSERVSELARTKLLKILFLLEEKSIKDFGNPFFELDFKVWQFGPVVEPIYKEITSGEIDIFKDYFIKNRFDEFESINGFNDDEFSNVEIKLMDWMIDFARNKMAKDFVKITHGPNSLWTKTAKKYNVYRELEYGDLTKTDYSIDFKMIFENNQNSYLAEKYNDYLDNALFEKNFK